MKRQVFLGGLVVLSVFACCGQSDNAKAEQRVSTTPNRQDGQMLEVVGIGKITPESMEFWKPDGTLDSSLVELFKKRIPKLDEYPFRFKLGRKNRIVLIRLADNCGYARFRYDGTESSEFLMPEKSERFAFVIVSAAAGESKISLVADVGEAKTASADLQVRKGSKTELDSQVLECVSPGFRDIGNINTTSVPFIDDSFYSYGVKWEILLGGASNTSSNFYYSYQALDGKRNPITLVDGMGKPVNATKEALKQAETSFRPNMIDGDPRKLVRYVQLFTFGVDQGMVKLSTNVEPQQMKWIRIQRIPLNRVRLDGILLDPK